MSVQEQLQQHLITLTKQLFTLFQPFFFVLISAILILGVFIAVVHIKETIEYKNGVYCKLTKLPYRSVKRDTGRYGEYLTYKRLKKFENSGAKFLFNVYVPKEDGETTEIDVLMICAKGIFVFESKNYSGWIFGSESQKNWYQTLPTGRGRSRKEPFFNPIMQNRAHIKHLKALLGEQVPMRSMIVFSDRCTLKSVQIKNSDVKVINRYNVASVVLDLYNKSSAVLSDCDITSLYEKLYPYSQVDDAVKSQHIADIQKHQTSRSVSHAVFSAANEPPKSPANERSQAENVHPTADTTEANAEPNEIPKEGTPENQCVEPESETPQILNCPKCNGNLVLRTATRGKNAGNQFYGCSNYPKCRYIQSLDSVS